VLTIGQKYDILVLTNQTEIFYKKGEYSMTIRQVAKQKGLEPVGKLTLVNHFQGNFYIDEEGNEFYITKFGVQIIDKDGGVW
jgi:hypothetical protein